MLKIKQDFPWFKKNPNVVYLDSAATTLKPDSVIQAVVDYYENQSTNPHNGDSKFAYNSHIIMDEARENIADFIGAFKEEIIFTSGATESLNLIANGLKKFLKKDDEVVLTYAEHASNLLPWYKLRDDIGIKIVFANNKNEFPKTQDFVNVLSNKTKIVSFASGGNLVGNILDEKEITKLVKEYNKNILVCVDATQSIQHREFNAKHSNVDFMVCSAHKLLGPTGIGIAYIKKELINQIDPLKYGGGMNFSIDLNSYELYDNFMRFEGGSPHTSGIYGFNACIKYLKSIGYEKIAQHEQELITYARSELEQIENVEIFVQDKSSATIAFNYKGVFCQDFANYLGTKNIIVRSGLSCAKIINNIIDTECAIRASFYIYNDKKDVDLLVKAIKEFKKGDELDGII